MDGFCYSSTAAKQSVPAIIAPHDLKGFVVLAVTFLVKLKENFYQQTFAAEESSVATV